MFRFFRSAVPVAAFIAASITAPYVASAASVTFVSPAPNQKLKGRVDVSVSANAAAGITSVEFLIDGVPLGPRDTRAPFALTLDAAAYPQGFYTITAVGRDAAGKVVESQTVTVFTENDATAAGIPAAHPRIGLVGGRLQELRQLACYDANGNAIPGCTRGKQAARFLSFMQNSPQKAETWQFALLHMITGDDAAATTAIQRADNIVACGWQCMASAHGHFLYVRDYMRNVALVYDWLHARLTPQQKQAYISYMNMILFLTWNNTPEANAIYDTSDWMTSNPMNNFYHSYLLGTTYVALATNGENPGTFVHEGVTHNAYYNMHSWDTSTAYTDLYTFLLAKINTQLLPKLDTLGKGGGWFEGENYGRASKRHLFEALLLLKQTTGLDLFNNPAHPFCRQAFYYELYTIQPGDRVTYPGGDQPRDARASVDAYHRNFMLLTAEGMRGTIESEYAQYWCNHVYTNSDDISIMIAWDFMLSRPENPERDHKASLPTSYIAEAAGWVHSRSDWSNNAVGVTMVSTDRIEGHQHRDQNAFVIYKGGNPAGVQGWIMTDGMPFSDDVPDWTWTHNTIIVADTEQRYGYGTGKILKYDAQPGYVYTVGDAADAYYTDPGHFGHGDDKMLKVFQRELVHILPNYIAVFDRVVPENGFENAVIKNLFHYPYNQPAISGDLITETLGSVRLFHKIVMPATPKLVWTDEASLRNDVWRLELQDASVRPSYLFMNVFQASNSTVAAMAPTERVSSEDGNMVGAVIKDAVQHHVIMFSSDPTGATPPGSIIYEVGATTPSLHNLFDLAPSTGYRVGFARVADNFIVTVTEGGERKTTAAGVLTFQLEGEPETRPVAQR